MSEKENARSGGRGAGRPQNVYPSGRVANLGVDHSADTGNDSTRPPSRQLRTRAAAEYLGLSVRTLENYRMAGEGPPFRKLGSSARSPVVYDLGSLQDWLEQFPECSNTGQAGGVA